MNNNLEHNLKMVIGNQKRFNPKNTQKEKNKVVSQRQMAVKGNQKCNKRQLNPLRLMTLSRLTLLKVGDPHIPIIENFH